MAEPALAVELVTRSVQVKADVVAADLVPHLTAVHTSDEAIRALDITNISGYRRDEAVLGLGRDFAGVHWRSDSTAGLRLGERGALELLDAHPHYAARRPRGELTGGGEQMVSASW